MSEEEEENKHSNGPEGMENFSRFIQQELGLAEHYSQREVDVLEQFDEGQLEVLGQSIKNLDKYSILLSSEIKHQELSLSSLPKELLSEFPELQQRKMKMIEKGRQNLKFIDLLLKPYRVLIQSNNSTKGHQEPTTQTAHSHHSHASSINTTNMFHHITSEWAPGTEINNIQTILNLSQKYWHNIIQTSHEGQNGQRRKILIVGCGMGRILSEFKKVFKGKGVDALLQGHESDTQNYLCAEYFLNRCTCQSSIYPYIHNFSNFVKSSSPFREIVVPLKLEDKSYFYPLTWGSFYHLYRTHRREWNLVVTFFHNYHIHDILAHLKLVYGMLKEGGIWIDFSTANFNHNVIPMSYKEYENILEKSQFVTLEKGEETLIWYQDPECLMNEQRKCYFRVMKK